MSKLFVLIALIITTVSGQCVMPGLWGRYYHTGGTGENPLFRTGPVLLTRVEAPNFNWGTSSPDSEVLNINGFNVRWTGSIRVQQSGLYHFRVSSDDSFWLYFNGSSTAFMQFPNLRTAGQPTFNDTIQPAFLVAGWNPITLDMREGAGNAFIGLSIGGVGGNRNYQVVTIDNLQTVCPPCAIVTSRRTITYQPTSGPSSFTVVLLTPPSTNVTVSVRTTCGLISHCELIFTPTNWNIPQTVYFKENPENKFVSTCPVVLNSTTCNAVSTVNINRITSPTKMAVAWGDPHFITFELVRFDFFGTGDYLYTKDPTGEFVVQSRQEVCGFTASCIFGIVIKYKSALMYVLVDRRLGASYFRVGNYFAEGVTVSQQSQGITFVTPNGFTVKTVTSFWHGGNTYYLRVEVFAPISFANQLRGLLGPLDPTNANSYVSRNGTVVSKEEFFRDYLLSPTENLFLNESAVIASDGSVTPIFSFNASLSCFTGNVPSNNNGTKPPVDPIDSDPNRNNSCEAPNATVFNAAKAYCDPLFNNTAANCCKKNVTADSFYNACLCDFFQTGDSEMSGESFTAFALACKFIAPGSCNVCDENCNNNGICNQNSICNCNTGFRGSTCDENWGACFNITSITPMTVNRCSSQNITATINGLNFFGSNLKCRVNGMDYPVSKVNNFLLTCSFPPPGPNTNSLTVSVIREGNVSCTSATIAVETKCCENRCTNNSTCTDIPGGFQCQCVNGFYGPLCNSQCLLNTPISSSYQVKEGGVDLSVTLSLQPSEPVTVTFSSNCVALSNCELVFTPANFNITQTVRVLDDARHPYSSCIVSVTSGGVCPDSKMVNVTRLSSPRVVGISFGDPHIVLYDRPRYDYFGVGEFILTRDLTGDFVVLARQGRCAGPASCNFGAAIKFQTAVMYVYVLQTGRPTFATFGDFATAGVSVEIGTYIFQFHTPTGITVKVIVSYWAAQKIYYMRIDVNLPDTYAGKMRGLLGNYDGISFNDYILRNGAQATFNQFTADWVVRTSENLFLNPNAMFETYPGPSSPSRPTPDMSCFPFNTTQPPLGTFESTDNVDDPTHLGNCSFHSTMLQNMAIAACSAALNTSTANCCRSIGVDVDDYYSTCLCDYALSRGNQFVADSLKAMSADCVAAQVRTGQNCNVCEENCNNNGNCVNKKCNCFANIFGPFCDENWNIPPAIISISPISGNRCTSKMITVIGDGLYGTNFSCVVNNVFVPATKINSNTISCNVQPPSFPAPGFMLQIARAALVSTDVVNFTSVTTCCDNPCQNGGTCTGGTVSFSCSCALGYFGTFCEETLRCPAQFYNNANWPATVRSTYGSGTCAVGYNSNPQRFCNATGFWQDLVIDVCRKNICPSVEFQNAQFPSTLFGDTAQGNCLPGFFGSVQRRCEGNGFGPMIGTCLPSAPNCPAETFNTANWPATLPGELARGTCIPGWNGAPLRGCQDSGAWRSLVLNLCQPNICPAETVGNANFPAARSFETVTVNCNVGFSGRVTRTCGANGWNSVVGSCAPASPTCPPNLYARANWPLGTAGSFMQGTCISGWTGTPLRRCRTDGLWETLVQNHCVRV